MSQKNFVDFIVELVSQTALVSRDRAKDPDAFDNYIINAIRKSQDLSAESIMNSWGLTPEERARINMKRYALQRYTRRRNPSSGNLLSRPVHVALPALPIKSLDERERELFAERHKTSPDWTEARAKAHYKELVVAEYNLPKPKLVKIKKKAQHDLKDFQLEKLHMKWRELLEVRGKNSRATKDDWRVIAEDVGIENLSTAYLSSVSRQVRDYHRIKKGRQKKG